MICLCLRLQKIVLRLHLGPDHVQLTSWEAAHSPRRKETRKQFSPGQGEDYLTLRDPEVSGDLTKNPSKLSTGAEVI